MSTNNSSSTQTEVMPGQFRVLRLESELSRLVLVISTAPNEGVLVALATNETEFAADADVLIRQDESGLEYEVLVETDIVATVHSCQLDEPLGQLADEFNNLLNPFPDLSHIEAIRLGLPLKGSHDARWQWKRIELSDLNHLATDR